MIKIISFFEEQIEKVILAIVGLVCLLLLVTRVFLSPGVVSFDNRKFNPGTIDNYIGKQADILKQKLDQPPASVLPEPNKPTFPAFTALLDSTVRGVDTGVYLPQPYISSRQRHAEREYRLPDIGEVNEVMVEHIRAVAYVPTEEVTEQSSYDQVGHEPNDIDLVTVEAKFDVAGLYQSFHECFAGEDVPEEWRDPCLARPVFAAVQLQRQELNPDGGWSDWQTVPRTKIDHLRRLFEVIEDTDRLPPGGIKVRLVQFDNREVMIDLLQPPVYQIASANEEWYPPSLHKKFAELQNQQQMEERRKAQEEKRIAQQEQRTGGTPEGGLGTISPGGAYYEDVGGGGAYRESRTRTGRSTTDRRTEGGFSSGSGRSRDSSRSRTSGRLRDSGRLTESGSARRPGGLRTGELDDRQTEKERLARARELSTQQSMNNVRDEFNKILIPTNVAGTDLSKMRELLVFWAHDDTVEPKKTYRYRIRLGVFNPIAGTAVYRQAGAETVALRDESRRAAAGSAPTSAKNAILWSEFASPAQTVEIPPVLYVFAKGIQEAAKRVRVQVSKHMMGYWHSEDFLVGQGEVIGKVVEPKPVEEGSRSPDRAAAGYAPTGRLGQARQTYGGQEAGQRIGSTSLASASLDASRGSREDTVLSEPETIDYGTGAVLVDVVPVSDWSGGSGRSMLARHYFDMLYSFDGTNIEHTPVDMKYWAVELRAAYGEIQYLQKEPREPLRAWGTQTQRGTFRRAAPGAEGSEDQSLMQEMMRMMMEGGGR